jgi:hypothetical protein
MENSELAFSIEDVQQTLETETKRERIEVPAGEYVCEIKAPLPDVRQDAKGHNKLLMPIEISGNEALDGQWIFEAIYMNNQHDDAGKVKDGIGKRKVARYAHALGLKTLTSLSELEGKYVKVDYGPNKNGYNEVREVSAFSVDASPISSILSPPVKEESGAGIPF